MAAPRDANSNRVRDQLGERFLERFRRLHRQNRDVDVAQTDAARAKG